MRVSLICDAAPFLLACSSVCNMTEAPQDLPPPTCYCSERHRAEEIGRQSEKLALLHCPCTKQYFYKPIIFLISFLWFSGTAPLLPEAHPISVTYSSARSSSCTTQILIILLFLFCVWWRRDRGCHLILQVEEEHIWLGAE